MMTVPPFFVSQFLEAVEDELAAFFRIDDEEVFFADFFIGSRIVDGEVAGAEEAMAAADLARLDVGQFKGNDLRIKEGDEPANRTDENGSRGSPSACSWGS